MTTMFNSKNHAYLVLEDGRIFKGKPFGLSGETYGEAVFATGMTGYQETLTDPSYFKQIVIQTAPHIGNTGMNDEDNESAKIWVSGYVLRDVSPIFSNWRANRSLESELVKQNIVAISQIDTRALTRHLRDKGAMRAGIFSNPDSQLTDSQMIEKVRAAMAMKGANLTDAVSVKEAFIYPAVGEKIFQVAAIDMGMKTNILRHLAKRGIETHVMPANSNAADILQAGVDGVFLSNGPGDPATANHLVDVTREVMKAKRPLFGICFGNQILGRALGLDTYKLVFGHRGQNQPVINLQTSKVDITTHNHGFAVKSDADVFETEFGKGEVTHRCLNDSVVEGLQVRQAKAFSVQYHPEAAAGPHDADHLFDKFVNLMSEAN
jgi:carbamoyl-phosphate synthase small subunit